jgi:hypothetical protein
MVLARREYQNAAGTADKDHGDMADLAALLDEQRPNWAIRAPSQIGAAHLMCLEHDMMIAGLAMPTNVQVADHDRRTWQEHVARTTADAEYRLLHGLRDHYAVGGGYYVQDRYSNTDQLRDLRKDPEIYIRRNQELAAEDGENQRLTLEQNARNEEKRIREAEAQYNERRSGSFS